jgi:hypothetical protein
LDLSWIDADTGEILAQQDANGDVLSNRADEHVLRVGNQRVEIHDLRLKHLLPAEGEELLGDISAAPHRLVNRFGIRARCALVWQLVEKKLHGGEHRAEDVVEVVRDAAHRFHLARLPERVDERVAFQHRHAKAFLRLILAAPLRILARRYPNAESVRGQDHSCGRLDDDGRDMSHEPEYDQEAHRDEERGAAARQERCRCEQVEGEHDHDDADVVERRRWSRDRVGPICGTIEDCAMVFNTIHGVDEKDPSTLMVPFQFDRNIKLSSVRIGYDANAPKEFIDKLREVGADPTPIGPRPQAGGSGAGGGGEARRRSTSTCR